MEGGWLQEALILMKNLTLIGHYSTSLSEKKPTG